MLKRRYETLGLDESAAVILGEVVRGNRSEGWCTKDRDHLVSMESILSRFNVVGFDDINGNRTWKLK